MIIKNKSMKRKMVSNSFIVSLLSCVYCSLGSLGGAILGYLSIGSLGLIVGLVGGLVLTHYVGKTLRDLKSI